MLNYSWVETHIDMDTFRTLTKIFLVACLMAVATLTIWSSSPALAASSSALKLSDDLDPSTKDYSGQSLIQREFVSVELQGANFSKADLRGTVFNGANLVGANLHEADLSDAMLYVTDLTRADLTDANLTATMLLKTNLNDADIAGADFSYATIDRNQRIQLCLRASGVNPTTGVNTRDSLECS